MGLLSKSKSSSTDARAGASPADASEIVREARTKARRRLIGAALLLGIGIIGFPLLFETQPRPISVDIPIEIPSREAVPPLGAPASRPARSQTAPLPRPPVESPASVAAERPPAVASASAATPKPVEPKPVEAKPVAVKPAEAKPAEIKPAEVKPAEAKPAPKPVEAAKTDDATKDDGRYVVQIGAFAEVTSARDARMKVEGLGLKTYTQVIESATGRRIRVRVGPYATKAEAEKAAAKIKADGLQAAVLVL